MKQLPNLTFFESLCGFTVPSPLPAWHVPGCCYTTGTETVLDGNQGIATPSGCLFNVCLSCAPKSDGSPASGTVLVQLYRVDAFSSVNATALEQTAGFQVIAQRSVSVCSTGITHPPSSLQPAEVALLGLATGSNKGGVTYGVRFMNDPNCPSFKDLRVIEWSAKLCPAP